MNQKVPCVNEEFLNLDDHRGYSRVLASLLSCKFCWRVSGRDRASENTCRWPHQSSATRVSPWTWRRGWRRAACRAVVRRERSMQPFSRFAQYHRRRRHVQRRARHAARGSDSANARGQAGLWPMRWPRRLAACAVFVDGCLKVEVGPPGFVAQTTTNWLGRLCSAGDARHQPRHEQDGGALGSRLKRRLRPVDVIGMCDVGII